MTKQNVIVSDTGDITESTINMAITLTLSSKSLLTYAPMPSSPMQKLPSGGFITLSRKKLWEKDDPVKASSTTHIKSPVFFSGVAEDHSSWIVSVQNLHMYNSIVSYGLIKLKESFNKIVIKQWQFHHPSALKKFDQITNASKGKQIVMFLDYDGTLSPIVDDPDRAFMSDQMRKVVKEVARYFPTAIVSGRCRAKVYSFVKLAGLFYAGSHGMDIKGPSEYQKGNKPVLFQPASEFLPMIDEVHKALVEKTKSTPGAKVENNKFCLSVHFRRVDEKWWSVLAEQVRSVLKEYPKLRLTQGRKVLEVRPTIKWDKGKALEFLLESLGFANCNDVLPVYIGDDRTDEDAFKVLRDRGQGIGILVSKIPKDTNASYSLQEPSEVMTFLHRLVEWKRLTPRT